MNYQELLQWNVLFGELIQYLPKQEAYEKLISFLIRSTDSLEGGLVLWRQGERSWEALPSSFIPNPEFQQNLERIFSAASPYIKVDSAQIYFPLFDSQKKTRGVLCLVRKSQATSFDSFEEEVIQRVLPLFQKILDRESDAEEEAEETRFHLGCFIGNSEEIKQVYRSIKKVINSA